MNPILPNEIYKQINVKSNIPLALKISRVETGF